jgi:hypothetical protein
MPKDIYLKIYSKGISNFLGVSLGLVRGRSRAVTAHTAKKIRSLTHERTLITNHVNNQRICNRRNSKGSNWQSVSFYRC